MPSKTNTAPTESLTQQVINFFAVRQATQEAHPRASIADHLRVPVADLVPILHALLRNHTLRAFPVGATIFYEPVEGIMRTVLGRIKEPSYEDQCLHPGDNFSQHGVRAALARAITLGMAEKLPGAGEEGEDLFRAVPVVFLE